MSTGAAGMPTGPWVLVVGMHRSGTSAVAGALGALGFHTPGIDDRMDWPESNPEHWESLSMSVFNDRLLEGAGGSWEAPPDLPEGWPDADVANRLPAPHAVASKAYPVPGPIVWKDPRLCLLLPYWRRFLPGPTAAIFIWRSPMLVAASLARRDGMDLGQGVALWEHYNRTALRNLAGMDTFVCTYESLLVDPSSLVSALAAWLGSLDKFRRNAPGWDIEQSVAGIRAERGRCGGGRDRHLARRTARAGRSTVEVGRWAPADATAGSGRRLPMVHVGDTCPSRRPVTGGRPPREDTRTGTGVPATRHRRVAPDNRRHG